MTLSPMLLALASTVVVAEEVVVTAPVVGAAPTNLDAQAQAHEVSMTPGAVTVVDGSDFSQRQVSNLGDALRYTPGVWAVSPGGNSAVTYSSRGSNLDSTGYDTNGVRMLEDGLPITTADGNNHNRFISPLVARQAVVARGANSVEYGGTSLGGIVNFVTPTAYDTPALQGLVSGGSFGYANAVASGGRVLENGVDGLVTVEGRHRDGFREHSQENQTGLYGNAGYRFNESVSTRVYASFLKLEQELPGALTRAQFDDDAEQAGSNAKEADKALNVEAIRIANKTTFRLGQDQRADVGASFERQLLVHPIEGANEWFPGSPGTLLKREHRDGWLTGRYAATLAAHEVVLGVNFGRSTVDERNFANNHGKAGALKRTGDWVADTKEAYGYNRWNFLPSWWATVGVKGVHAAREVVTSNAAGVEQSAPSETYTNVAPSAGVIWRWETRHESFANVTRLFEAPTLMNLANPSTTGADDTLDAMTGTSVELGTRGGSAIDPSADWSWEATAFYAWITDEILSVKAPAGSFSDSVSGNVDRTTHAGIELAGSGVVYSTTDRQHQVVPRAAVTVNRFNFVDHELYDNNRLPGAPLYVARGEVLYRHGSGFYAGPTWDLVGAAYADFTNSYDVDPYALMGLRGGYQARSWSSFVEVRNLTNRDYVASATPAAEATVNSAVLNPGEPRAIYGGAEFAW